ncbi:MAG TPA: tRNA lysidine(34) synthetase TilS [Candidatus Eisenbacteria bacterium]|jgi:tRNA(Ile)-lysidine synthase
MPPGARLLVALSGGADSTALLYGLARIAPEFGLSLHAAHLHHGLRGEAADADLEFVRGLCSRLGVPLVAARRDLPALMKRRGLSGENGLRVLRRRFLAAAARRARADAIATAHTADDQLETVLMRLARGTGLSGLGGMRERHGAWLKPLLGATRLEIESDLRRGRIDWREDLSNRDPAWTRNRLRHGAVPALLRAIDPSSDPARARAGLARRFAEAAREVRDAERALGVWLGRDRAAHSIIQGGVAELSVSGLASFPIAARRLALHRTWRLVAPGGPGLTRRHLAALCSLLAGAPVRGRVDLPAGMRAERDHDVVRLRAERGAHGALEPRASGADEWLAPSGRPRGASGAIARECGSPAPGSRQRRRGSMGVGSAMRRARGGRVPGPGIPPGSSGEP